MTRAYEELNWHDTTASAPIVGRNLAWAAGVLNYDESRLPHIVMHSQIHGLREEAERPASSAVV